MEDLQIRYSLMEDGTTLKKWLQNPVNWPHFPIASEKEAVDFANNWLSFVRYHASLTAVLNQEPVGMGTLFLMPYKKVSHSALLYFIVDARKRKQGIGFDLLKNLINLAKSYFHLEGLVVELYQDSPALALIKKMGFEQFAFQENYLKTDKEHYSPRFLFQLFLSEFNASEIGAKV